MDNQNPVHYRYTAKYKKLGKTTVIRVPIHIKDEITEIIRLLEIRAKDEGIKRAEQLLQEVIETLSEVE
jgi:hypothetical protein